MAATAHDPASVRDTDFGAKPVSKPSNGLPATYVFCTAPAYASLATARDRARQQSGWAWREIAAGHDCMVTAPRETAELLMEIAA